LPCLETVIPGGVVYIVKKTVGGELKKTDTSTSNEKIKMIFLMKEV
jgi:hypothetical protein